ncbi:hypothetical protein U1707_17085 [Sphingomonas sp. PB2P12]
MKLKTVYRLYREEREYGAQAWRPEPRFGHAGADADPAATQQALVVQIAPISIETATLLGRRNYAAACFVSASINV